MDKIIPRCPKCKCSKSHIHDYRNQMIKDIPIFGMKSILVLRKRRYKCVDCGKQHYEDVPFIGKYKRMTMRLIMFIADKLKDKEVEKISVRNLISPIYSILKEFDVDLEELPEVLCIDEFKGNINGHKC